MRRRVYLFVLLGFVLLSAEGVSQKVALKTAFPSLKFRHVLFLTHSGDHTNRLFAVRQEGIIHVFQNSSSTLVAPVFLNVSGKLSSAQYEEGLLGLAFPPDFPSSQVFYVCYTAPSTKSPGGIKNVLARYAVSASDPNVADPSSERIVLEIEKQHLGHNGGMLAFGPDSMLYVGVGDGDSSESAQTLTTLLGKILRIDVRGDSGYSIPSDNPFAGDTTGVKKEIWAYGFRNPWRFSIDPQSGQLWAGDVGEVTREEIDLVTPGANYGWNVMEGDTCGPGGSNCDTTGFTMPVLDYGRALGYCVTGGYIYRGASLPQLRGAYIYADYGSGYVFLLWREGGVVVADSVLLHSRIRISSFGIDEQNELYVLDHSNGNILKIVGQPVSSSVELTETPLQFALGQNYPNPFNPFTIIKYTIAGAGGFGLGAWNTRLVVYDVLGREVAVLVNEKKTPGNYEVRFDGAGLASGIYIYRLTAGGFVETKEMALVR